jgi:hypothetical protein
LEPHIGPGNIQWMGFGRAPTLALSWGLLCGLSSERHDDEIELLCFRQRSRLFRAFLRDVILYSYLFCLFVCMCIHNRCTSGSCAYLPLLETQVLLGLVGKRKRNRTSMHYLVTVQISTVISKCCLHVYPELTLGLLEMRKSCVYLEISRI